MDYFRSFQISAAGLAVEMLRMQTASLNLANANSSAPPGAEPFRPLEVVAAPIGSPLQSSVASAVGAAVGSTAGANWRSAGGSTGGLPAGSSFAVPGGAFEAGTFYRPAPGVTLEPRLSPPRMVYDPGHPHADANGFVAYANVDVLSEMVAMMRATRAYEANIKAVNAAKAMAQQALEIGSGK